MNGEGVCYPAFLLGGSDAKPMAFPGPEALFISGRFRAPIGPMKEEVLADSSGRSWTLNAVTAIGRWGSWNERLLLWWKRQYLIEFEATEGPATSLDEFKAAMQHRAALRADTEIDDPVRQYFLEGWSKFRGELAAAETFEAVAEAIGLSRLYPDHWLNGRGRSNRAEYLSVLLSAMVIMAVVVLMASHAGPSLWLIIALGLGIVLPACWPPPPLLGDLMTSDGAFIASSCFGARSAWSRRALIDTCTMRAIRTDG